jgi:CBS-domain-containing membrane protein
MKVRDAMSPGVKLCTPGDTLKDAAEPMAALGVGVLPVTDNERLVGMISDRDITIRGIALGRGPDSRVGPRSLRQPELSCVCCRRLNLWRRLPTRIEIDRIR